MLYLEEDESFSMSGYVTSPGYQRISLQGYLVSNRSDGVYAAPLIPQLFYGADGNQLQTWRQNITGTGEQVLLSRSGGQPSVPRHELYWRKVSEPKRTVETTTVTPVQVPSPVIPALILVTGLGLIYLLKK